MEGAVDLERAEVVRQVELVGCVSRVDNEVEGEGQGLVPVLVFSADEVLRAELERVVLLRGGVRDCVDFGA